MPNPNQSLSYPKRGRRKFFRGVKGRTKPWLDPSCLYWYDPSDLSTLTLWDVTVFGETDKSFISTPKTPDLNAVEEFTVEMSVAMKAITNDTAFASNGDFTNDACGWAIVGGDGVNQGNSVFVWTRGEGGAWIRRASAVYDTDPGEQLTHFVVRYNRGTITILRNGVVESLTGTGTVPVKLGSSNAALMVGAWQIFSTVAKFGCAVFRYWTKDIGAAAALTHWNNGVPLLYDQMSESLKDSSLVCALEKNSRTCRRTGRVFTNTLAVTSGKVCTQWRDKSRNKRHQNAPLGKGYWLGSINSVPCLDSFIQNGMIAVTDNANNTATGSIFCVMRWNTLTGTENWAVGVEDDTGNVTLKYGMVGFERFGAGPFTYRPQLRIHNVGSPNGSVRVGAGVGTSDYLEAVPYVINWNGDSTGGANSYSYYGNGVNYATTINGVNQNSWLNQVGTTDILTVGCALTTRDAGGGGFIAASRGIQAAFGPILSANDRDAIENICGLTYAITT